MRTTIPSKFKFLKTIGCSFQYYLKVLPSIKVSTALGVPLTIEGLLAKQHASIEAKEPIWFEQCQGVEGPCDSKHAYKRRQNTAYVEDSMNYVVLCDECMAANEAYWNERWSEYYAGRL